MINSKNFKEIYEKIYATIGQEIEKKRKNALIKNIVAYCIILVLFCSMFFIDMKYAPIFILIIIISAVILDKFIKKANNDYKIAFKEQVVNEIVKQSNFSFKYYYYNGIEKKLYTESGFDFLVDRYYTEDLIEGELENGSTFKMSQVKTERRKEDSEGHISYVTTFLGLYGIINLNVLTNEDFIIKENSIFSKYDTKRIEMESTEFEKYYDVFSSTNENTGKQNVLEILTPEIIEQFVKIRNIFKQPIRFRIYKDKIYFRISLGDVLEAPTYKSSINFDLLRKYFLIIDLPRMIYETIIDSILVKYGDSEKRENRNISNMTYEQKEEYFKKLK